HTSQSFQLLVEALEQDPEKLPTWFGKVPAADAAPPRFEASLAGQEEVRAILRRESGVQGDFRIILLNPNASDLLPLRKWPIERYVELGRRLLERFPEIWIVMTGGPDEADAIRRVASEVGSPRCLSLAGKTTLPQLLVLY